MHIEANVVNDLCGTNETFDLKPMSQFTQTLTKNKLPLFWVNSPGTEL